MVLGHTMRTSVILRHMTGINHPLDSLQTIDLLNLLFRYFSRFALVSNETHVMNDKVFHICYVHDSYLFVNYIYRSAQARLRTGSMAAVLQN